MAEKAVSRRTVLRAGAALALSVPALPAFARTQPHFDVIVAGSGAGGFAAAIRAAENGARVLLLEANSWVGGASRVSTGIFGCAGHPIQKKLGFTATAEDLYKNYIGVAAATRTKAKPEAARILADGAVPAADWLASLGVEWSTKKAQKFFLNIKEGHRLGELLIDSLERRARALGVEIRTRHRAERLLVKDGRIAGVRCRTTEGSKAFPARAVVLATGGFEANPRMIDLYIGHGWGKAGIYCTPADRGDGQRMAEEAGAGLADMEVFKANPTIHEYKGNRYNLRSVIRQGAIAVNGEGRRFMNETGSYYESHRIWALPQKQAWVLFGDPALEADPRLKKLVAAGDILSSETLSGLARAIGAEESTLEVTLRRYEAMRKFGRDEDFGRGNLKEAFGGAWYAARIQPMIQGTFGGVMTNVRTQALTPEGRVFPGLYAVGECAAAGLRGLNPQTANAVFGSIAGREAAAYSREA